MNAKTKLPTDAIVVLFEVETKGQYWPLTCNTNHNTMFDMQAVNI